VCPAGETGDYSRPECAFSSCFVSQFAHRRSPPVSFCGTGNTVRDTAGTLRGGEAGDGINDIDRMSEEHGCGPRVQRSCIRMVNNVQQDSLSPQRSDGRTERHPLRNIART